MAIANGVPLEMYGQSAGLNHLYGYVNSNPLKYVDPFGLELFNCKCVSKTGGGSGYKNGTKQCIYSCTGEKSGKIDDFKANGVENGDNDYCLGAVLGNSFDGGINTLGFGGFDIETEGWGGDWDSWGKTSDIYNKLKNLSN